MTKEDALRRIEGWSPREKTTYDSLRAKYRELRADGGATLYITRKMLAEAYGSRSIGTASKFMAVIEVLEADQPHMRRAAAESPQETTSSAPHSLAVQAALDGLQAALGSVSRAIADARVREGAEAAARYQRLLDDRQAAADAGLQAAEERIDDLESAAAESGDESFGAEFQVEELRASLAESEAARDNALAAARDVAQRLEVELAHANASKAQIEALQGQVVAQTAEIADLKIDARWHREAVDLGQRLRVENAALTERATVLADRVVHLEALLQETNERHQRDMAEERRRATAREALLMQMSVGQGHGERG